MTHNTTAHWVYDHCALGHCFCEDHGGENWNRCCWCGSVQSEDATGRLWDSRILLDSPDTGYDYYAAYRAQQPSVA